MKKKMRSGNAGFTLVEVILSIAILSLISVPLVKYFMDSLGYSIRTKQKQNATLVAQETIEFMKSQETMMKWVPAKNAAGVTVMHYDIPDSMKEEFGVPLDQTIEQFDAAHPAADYDRNEGKGKLVYDYSVTPAGYDDGYDVRVTLETDMGYKEVSKPMVYGIDDTTNVVAAEYNEEEDAMMQLMARNAAAIIQQSGGYIIGVTPTPTASSGPIFTVAPDVSSTPDVTTGPVWPDVETQTEEMIKENLRRTIHVDMDLKSEVLADGPTQFYTVRVYYEYSCINISTTDPDAPDVVFSNDIINTNVIDLQGFYLMFNKVHLTEDIIEFHWLGESGLNPPIGQYPQINLICQDLSVTATSAPGEGEPLATSAPGVSDPYTPTIYLNNFSGWEWQPKVRTNLEDPSKFLLDNSSDIANKTLIIDKLTDSGNPVRIFKITVDVYKKGDRDDGKDPIIEMITSKSE